MRPRKGAIIGIAICLMVTVPVAEGLADTAHATVPSPQITGSVAAPTAVDISPICDAPDASTTLGPAPTVPSNPTRTVVTPAGGVYDFTVTSSGIYVYTGTMLDTYTLSGSPNGSFAMPARFGSNDEVSPPVVDSSGNIYLSSYYGKLVDKFSPSGTVLWSVDPQSGNPTGLFGVGNGSEFQLVVSVIQNTKSSTLLNSSTGAVNGTFALVDDFDSVTQESNGNLLFSGNGYVETLDPTGSTVLSTFGSASTEGKNLHTGSGTQFYYTAQAVQGPDGTIYTADPLNTIESTSSQGHLQGTTDLGGNLSIGGDNFYLVGTTLYYQGGPPFNGSADNISSVPLATLQAYLGAIHVPTDSLGWGAGLSSAASGNYFAPGTTPAVSADFDPWWAGQAAHLQLSYSVEDSSSLNSETVPAPTTLVLPTTAAGLASIPLTIPATDQRPGPYQVQASLFDTTTSPPTRLGTTCMPYTVGAIGDGLNLAGLPSGIGAGGPADPRGVALDSQLGLDGYRGATVNWGTFLPNCSASSPTAATCGPAAMTFANASTDYFKAAALAVADHVAFWVQASGGDPVSSALVSDGWWQGDVAALVNYYDHPPVGCGACAPVTMWEPWNESNNTGWGNAGLYVTQVLQPFYAAVKSVEPGSTSTVIGGSTIDVSIGWWQQLINAGGLSSLDVASIHPYTGNNESFEEYGNIPEIQQLEGMLGGKPLWFTEVGWWSDGDYNLLNQANEVSRAMIWQKVLNIPVWSYFYNEGNWGNDGVSFSLIQASNVDDWVKPAALATMATASEIANRPYLALPPTGVPQTHEATFGPAGAGADQLAAVWSDGLSATGAVTLTAPGGGPIPVTVTDEYGKATTVSAASGTAYSLPLSDQVTYITYPVGDTLAVGPTQAYGGDLAASSSHATAAATSGNPSGAIAGTTTGTGWTSASGDTTPSLTVTLAGPSTINRVVVDTQSVGSTATSVRDYTVSVDRPSVGWTTVATVDGQYRNHEMQLAFDPVVASAVRISVTEVNFGGYYGGGIPPWWASGQVGTAFLHALQVYGGSGTASQVNGSGLTPLTPGNSGSSPPTTTTTAPPTTTTTAPPTTTTTTTAPPTTTTVPPTTTASPPPTRTYSPPRQLQNFNGYWLTTSDGSIYTFGSVASYGSTGALALNKPIVGMAATPDGKGYRLVATDGGIFTFGDADFEGSTGGLALNRPIVSMATTPSGNGYWLVASDGGIFAFGDASFYGSTGGLALNRPIVDMAATPDGRGYWLVASDGGIFAFGDASFYGSTGGMALNRPIVGMASTSDGNGYWLVASDGGIFSFGDASFHGSTGAITLNQPIAGMRGTPDGNGYWLVARDGGIFTFGDASFYGSVGGLGLKKPVIAIN